MNTKSIGYSVNGFPIRLTDERWIHIVENHTDMAGHYYEILEVVSNPTWVFKGDTDDLWAVKLVSERKAILVIYKELIDECDGFIITAFFTKKIKKLLQRTVIWQQKQ